MFCFMLSMRAMPEIDFGFLIVRPCEAKRLRAGVECVATSAPAFEVSFTPGLEIKGYRDSLL